MIPGVGEWSRALTQCLFSLFIYGREFYVEGRLSSCQALVFSFGVWFVVCCLQAFLRIQLTVVDHILRIPSMTITYHFLINVAFFN